MAERLAIYVADSSSLIELRRRYPRHLYPVFWDNLASLVASGRMIAPQEVRDELMVYDDEIAAWAKENDAMFRGLDAQVANLVRAVLEEFVDWQDEVLSRDGPFADPVVVAVAVLEKGRQDSEL